MAPVIVKLRRSSANNTLPEQPWQELEGELLGEIVLDFAQHKVLAPLFEHGIVPRQGSLLIDVRLGGVTCEYRVHYKLEPGRLELETHGPIAGQRHRRIDRDNGIH